MEWEKYYNEALAYGKAAKGGLAKSKLGNHVLYNLISLAIENLLTALMVRDSMLPQHSAIGSMLHELKKNYHVPQAFFQQVKLINRYMDFCSLEIVQHHEPSVDDLNKMCLFMEDLKEWVEIHLHKVQKTG